MEKSPKFFILVNTFKNYSIFPSNRQQSFILSSNKFNHDDNTWKTQRHKLVLSTFFKLIGKKIVLKSVKKFKEALCMRKKVVYIFWLVKQFLYIIALMYLMNLTNKLITILFHLVHFVFQQYLLYNWHDMKKEDSYGNIMYWCFPKPQ